MRKLRMTLLLLLACAPIGLLQAAGAAAAVAPSVQAGTLDVGSPRMVTNGKKAEKRAKPKATKKPRRPSHAETPASGSR
jgi:hypothetical protein